MKISKKTAPPTDGFSSAQSGGVTAENYRDRCSAFIKSRGGAGFVIRAIEGSDGALASHQPATEAQWISWMYYFDWRGIPHRYGKTRGMTTVPCEWPEDFDCEALPSDREARLPADVPPISPERRQEIARRMCKLAASVIPRDPRSKRFNIGDLAPVLAEQHIAELMAKNANADMTLSPAAFATPLLKPLAKMSPPLPPPRNPIGITHNDGKWRRVFQRYRRRGLCCPA